MKIEDVKIGTPATAIIWQDTQAAVVTHRTPKRVKVARVETDPATFRLNEPNTPDPGYRVEGDLTKIIEGTERTYTLKVDSNGNAYATSTDYGRVALGHSVTYRVANS